MSEQDRTRPFVHRAAFDRPELVGARWWQEGLLVAADPITRRSALSRIAIVVGTGCVILGIVTRYIFVALLLGWYVWLNFQQWNYFRTHGYPGD